MKKLNPLLLALIVTACSHEDYGFVARLGNDTTSIEHIRRYRYRIVGDAVEHSPRVIRNHWEARLDVRGNLVAYALDKKYANPNPDEPANVSYQIAFGGDSVTVTQTYGGSSRTFRIGGAEPVTVPWEAYDYGMYELLFEQAMKQKSDSVPVKQFQPGYGQFGSGLVRKMGDSVTFVTTGLAGTGVAKLDANGRMLSYSGMHTTYKQLVERVADVPDLAAIEERFAREEKASPVRSLSVRDTTRARIGGSDVAIDYGRPFRRGRTILGNIVPYNVVWRTGANAATQLMTSAPITIGGVSVPAGTYTLWTLPDSGGATLIINRQHGQWGTHYEAAQDLARVPLKTEVLPEPVEEFSIDVVGGNLVLEWDTFRWSTPIGPR